MSQKPSKWRVFKAVVLNFPDDEVPGLKERFKGKSSAKTQPSTAETNSHTSWDSVLAHAAESKNKPEQGNDNEGSALWQPASVRHGEKPSAWKKIVRWSVLGLILLFGWIGLRTALWGNATDSPQQQVPLSAQYPQEQAAGIAERFAIAYLSFDEGKEDTRAKELSQFYSGAEASGKLGWDGKGKQSAANPVVLSVEPIDEQKSRVVVLSDVTSYENGKAKSTKPMALEMSVSVTDEGAAVYGNPAYVGVPTPPTIAPNEPNNFDSELTQETKDSAQEFFTAYATNDTLDSLTAPGAHISGLNGAVQQAQLTKWNVGAGNESEREAWATVNYQSNGATVTNSYQLTLVKVSGGESAKWQIKEIKGSEN